MTLSSAGSATPDIERFISETNFSGYQQITLPGGRIIPGTDRSPVADRIFRDSLAGKSVLDVGCYYGYFLHEAIRRGATRAVGIEADPERFRIASTLARQWEGKIDIHEGLLEDVELDEKFDVVVFLNVLHHVKDPVPVIRKLAGLCRGTLVVEFRQPHDSQFVMECFHRNPRTPAASRSLLSRGLHRLRLTVETRLVERLTRNLPIVGVGSAEYHRSYFFSPNGFTNMFQVHNRLFRSIEFRPSTTRGQVLAFCQCGE
jgi:2-polyprenyl-3-methyl-5-hydroxy-6-metoxy-1,4-benzoquinol methylase